MQALHQHISSHQTVLQKFAFHLTKNRADSEDLFQETVFKILSRAHQFQQGTNFTGWALTIMKRLFINEFRRKNRQRDLLAKAPKGSIVVNRKSAVENDGIQELAVEEIDRLIADLPPYHRTPFLMRYEGYQYQEMASALSLPEGTLKSQVFQAKKNLQKKYRALG